MAILGYILGFFVVLGSSIWGYTAFHPEFGGRISEEEKQRFAKSKQWNGKIFKNRSETEMSMSPAKIMQALSERRQTADIREPKTALPILPFDRQAFEGSITEQFIWYGHSVILLRMAGKNILIDPMFGDDATAIAPMKTKRFSDDTLKIIDQLPPIDIVCLSHDHYDHLDYKSILKLKDKVDHFYVALGVGRHLKRWGIAADKITEMDWWDSVALDGLQLTFTESRHFAGRGPTDRFQSLWGGWILKSALNNVYWSGDGGYDAHFKEIGEKYGPFDLGMMECGQYHPNWAHIHMTPSESVKAAQEAGVKVAMPVHCLGFALAMHDWQEPQALFFKEAKAKGLPAFSPQLGELRAIQVDASLQSQS